MSALHFSFPSPGGALLPGPVCSSCSAFQCSGRPRRAPCAGAAGGAPGRAECAGAALVDRARGVLPARGRASWGGDPTSEGSEEGLSESADLCAERWWGGFELLLQEAGHQVSSDVWESLEFFLFFLG